MKSLSYKRLSFGVVIVFVALVISSCSSEKKKKDAEEQVTIESLEINEKLIQDVKTVKEIFYSLPSPLETAMILKQAGAVYNEELLNPTDNVTNYVTNKKMALNLGVYTTDLSYASLFDQTQATINYMSAAKKMADGLGILGAIDENVIERLEANINNRDVIMDIISETIMSSSSFFEENDRQAMSTIVLVGGWIEGLHIAVSLAGENVDFDNNELIKRIIDQKLTLTTVISLLEDNVGNEDVDDILASIKELKGIFDKIQISSTEIKSVTDNVTNVTTLKSKTKVEMDLSTYTELKEKIKLMRNSFTL